MTSPGQPIDLDYDKASAAASELKDSAARIDELAAKFKEAVAAFEADARLDGDVMPASKATLDLLTQSASTVRSNISEIFDKIDRTGDALNGRVAEAQSSEAQSTAGIESIDTGGTPR
ncbi:MAG: hypothetical protein WAW17_14585 [Rhodococcus sp. (in: high G+C Gram-positive bacteria)]|uniref:hypothetical protein n=1 Tax=Rhodococcus sp. TaxID=1831 RepID=UPI003BAFA7CC